MEFETKIAQTANSNDFQETLDQVTKLLQQGHCVALPTETVYGLAANIFDPIAIEKIFTAKERPAFDPLIVHIPKIAMLEKVAIIPTSIEKNIIKLIEELWPGPLTIILPKKQDVPNTVTSNLDTVAVRQSAHPIFKKIIENFDQPLAAPSANRFGRISPTSAQAAYNELNGRIPLIVDGGACSHGIESTIISVSENPNAKTKKQQLLIKILRPGPITADQLKAFGKVQPFTSQKHTEQPQAPGQLPSHYAPSTPLYLFEKPEDFQPEAGKRYGLLSYRGKPEDGYLELCDYAQIETLSPRAGKLPEAAVRFFSLLRKLDESKLDAIIAEPIPERGIGVALMDRLKRASAAHDIP